MATNNKAQVHELPIIINKPDVEDVIYQHVANPTMKKVIVVYNHFNVEAILAAAYLKQTYKDFVVISVEQIIPKDADLYTWIGVDPAQIIDRELAAGKEHRVYSSHDIKAADEEGIRPGIMEEVCKDFTIRQTPRLQALMFQAARFYDNKSMGELGDLAFVFNEVRNANNVLNGIKSKPITSASEMRENYLDAVWYVKAMFNSRYKTIHALDDTKVKDVIYTAFSDYNFIIALRLMKMAHTNFVNQSHSLNGSLIYSNMKQPQFTASQEKIIMMN